MKTKYIILTAIAGLFMSACQDLNTVPVGQLGEAELYTDEYGAQALLTRFYNYLPIEDFGFYANDNFGNGGSNNWEAYKNSLTQASGEVADDWGGVQTNDNPKYWEYGRVREINTFITIFKTHQADFEEAKFNNILGEAHFLRAFIYFAMVKRYGGIPIVTEVQDPLAPLESLQTPRATEYDSWKFIHDDLQFAIDNLAEEQTMANRKQPNRANKYTAAALMSRAMLYAGTIAKYTQYLGLDADPAVVGGFAGISPDKANEFFQYAYDAGNLIINSGRYELYKKYPDDLATNYAQLFLDNTSRENIFVKVFDDQVSGNTRLRHCYDAMMSPNPDMGSGPGTHCSPTLELMLLYDFPALTEAPNGLDTTYAPIRFPDRETFTKDNIKIRSGADGTIHQGAGITVEPRLQGTVYFHGDELRGAKFDIQRGAFLTYPNTWTAGASGNGESGWAPANIPVEANPDGTYKSGNRILGKNANERTYTLPSGEVITTAGRHGIHDNNGSENNTYTGVFTRKYVDPALPISRAVLFGSETDWIVFRLGEIYLNVAEAAYELGKKQEAFDKYIQPIRERAGSINVNPYKGAPADVSQKPIIGYPIYTFSTPYAIDENLQFIRDERQRELAFENHRWWDIRRWRTCNQILDHFRPRGLMCYYVADTKDWVYLNHFHKGGKEYDARNKNIYWMPIPQDEINKNPNLLPKNPLR
ncbi:glycan metabolism protein RagB [Bacteroidia bacterium]|nr:glycan metabolism protein RagB [Bacteroidia bacterium]GHT27636.1 glycan metabolism protein RagB [Bacteroidia bacterium]